MDFTNRGQQNNNAPRRGAAFSPTAVDDSSAGAKSTTTPNESGRHTMPSLPSGDGKKLFRWGGALLVVVLGVLIAAALALLMVARPSSENDYVNPDKLQAVFLTNDQVYFGHVTSLSSDYLVLDGIYYLQSAANNSNKAASNGQITLIKLGCELHKPQDRMVINQNQVNFWENLQDDGQVAKLVKQWQEANPNGQTCNDANTGTTPVQGSTDTTPSTTDTTPATNTTPKNNDTTNTNSGN